VLIYKKRHMLGQVSTTNGSANENSVYNVTKLPTNQADSCWNIFVYCCITSLKP